MMMREDGATNVINERVMSDEFARLLFKLLLLHASDQAAKGWSSDDANTNDTDRVQMQM